MDSDRVFQFSQELDTYRTIFATKKYHKLHDALEGYLATFAIDSPQALQTMLGLMKQNGEQTIQLIKDYPIAITALAFNAKGIFNWYVKNGGSLAPLSLLNSFKKKEINGCLRDIVYFVYQAGGINAFYDLLGHLEGVIPVKYRPLPQVIFFDFVLDELRQGVTLDEIRKRFLLIYSNHTILGEIVKLSSQRNRHRPAEETPFDTVLKSLLDHSVFDGKLEQVGSSQTYPIVVRLGKERPSVKPKEIKPPLSNDDLIASFEKKGIFVKQLENIPTLMQVGQKSYVGEIDNLGYRWLNMNLLTKLFEQGSATHDEYTTGSLIYSAIVHNIGHSLPISEETDETMTELNMHEFITEKFTEWISFLKRIEERMEEINYTFPTVRQNPQDGNLLPFSSLNKCIAVNRAGQTVYLFIGEMMHLISQGYRFCQEWLAGNNCPKVTATNRLPIRSVNPLFTNDRFECVFYPDVEPDIEEEKLINAYYRYYKLNFKGKVDGDNILKIYQETGIAFPMVGRITHSRFKPRYFPNSFIEQLRERNQLRDDLGYIDVGAVRFHIPREYRLFQLDAFYYFREDAFTDQERELFYPNGQTRYHFLSSFSEYVLPKDCTLIRRFAEHWKSFEMVVGHRYTKEENYKLMILMYNFWQIYRSNPWKDRNTHCPDYRILPIWNMIK